MEELSFHTPQDIIEDGNCLIYRFIAANNLVGQTGKKWSISALEQIQRQLIGKPLQVDHLIGIESGNVGLILNSRLIAIEPNEARHISLDKLGRNGDAQLNRSIINQEGLLLVVVDGAVLKTHWIADKLSNGFITGASVGGVDYLFLICPLCGISFCDCQHKIPDNIYVKDPESAPFAIRTNVLNVRELSLTNYPMSSGSIGVIRPFLGLNGEGDKLADS